MPAIPKEIGLALEEGVLIHPNRTIRRLLIREERVVGVELVHALKETLEGTARHRSFEGTETILEADQVIPAVGQVVSPEGLATVLGEGSFISADPDGRVAGSGRLFAGGDACPGGGSVSHAVGSGHLAARRIDAQLRKQDPPPPRESAFLPFSRLNLHYFEPSGALSVQRLPVDSRTGFEEIERTGSTGEIAREADRCFSCGHCLECDNCWTLCPDNAVLKTVPGGPEKGPYVFDLAYCKGCGLCVKECPSGHILMVPEP